MSFVAQLFKPRQNKAFEESFWTDFVADSKSGVSVTASTALKVTAVFACVRVLGEGIAQVPLKIYKSRPDGKGSDPAKDHPLYNLLYRKPNDYQTSFEFRENLAAQVALGGNFYAFKSMARGVIREIIPFEPGTVTPRREKGRIWYDVTSGEKFQTFPSEVIWHVRGPTWSTWHGLVPVKLAREAIGISLAAEEAHAKLHKNGVQTSGLYSIDGTLDETQHKQLKKWVNEQVVGKNRFKPLILDRGAKFTPTGMTGVDSQHLETRRYQVEEICRACRVMPIMIGHPDKTATYASAEQMFLAHVVHTLQPWYTRIEQSIDTNLVGEKDISEGYYSKFSANALMRGASKDRAEFYWKLFQMGALNPNEIRALEEYNAYEGGDTYRVPGNTLPTEEEENENDQPGSDS
jgi:HK97 family phage portal protein